MDTTHLLHIITRSEVIAKNGHIPEKLEVLHEERKRYRHLMVKTGNLDLKPHFQDALITNWWKNVDVDFWHICITQRNKI